jgi:hypothetical protein
MAIVTPMESLHPPGDTGRQTGVPSMGRDGDILQHHHGLTTRKLERVGLQMPLVHKCHQCGRVHHHQTVGDEPSKRHEPRTPYEWRVSHVPHQGVMRVDPEQE